MLILPANSLTGGYEIANSLRFDDGSSDYLNRTLGTPTSTQKCSISFWVKLSNLSSERSIFEHRFNDGTNKQISLFFSSSDNLQLQLVTGGAYDGRIYSSQLFRDVSAWYNILIAIDTTLATSGDRLRMYVNGNEVTSFSTELQPTQNYNLHFTSGQPLYIGRNSSGAAYYDGYMSEYYFIDGQQLTPSDFGEFDEDSGIWKPIKYTGTYGTNGFYLDFENSGSLGTDQSGNGNNFTVNNLTSIDQVTDTPTNNYATGNSLVTGAPGTYSDGNLTNGNNTNNWQVFWSSIAVSSGKWYVEAKAVSGHFSFGISETTSNQLSAAGPEHFIGGFTKEVGYYSQTGNKYVENSGSSYGATYTAGDIIGMALDLDSGTRTITFYKNGVSQGVITLPSSMETMTFGIGNNQSGSSASWNFGNPPFTISSGNSDANGYGNFEYSVPSGYYALNTKNLAEFG